MRFRYDKDLEALVEIRDGSNYFEEPRGPAVISDSLGSDVNGLRHMVTGEMISSKSRFRQVTKENGCVEVGNERRTPRKPISLDRQKRVETIKYVYDMCRQGRQAEMRHVLGIDE